MIYTKWSIWDSGTIVELITDFRWLPVQFCNQFKYKNTFLQLRNSLITAIFNNLPPSTSAPSKSVTKAGILFIRTFTNSSDITLLSYTSACFILQHTLPTTFWVTIVLPLLWNDRKNKISNFTNWMRRTVFYKTFHIKSSCNIVTVFKRGFFKRKT